MEFDIKNFATYLNTPSGNYIHESVVNELGNELLNALQVSHYAMCKFAPNDCSREINTAKELLIKYIRTV